MEFGTRLTRLLSVRLFLLLLPVMIVTCVIFAYINISTHASHLMNITLQNANDTSDLIARSTRYSMLLNRKEDVAHIIRTIGGQPDVESIRIYDKKGRMTFSTVSREVGTIVDMQSKACYMCHTDDEPQQSVPLEKRTRISQTAEGWDALNVVNPIRNEPDCYNAACHAHSSEQIFLGMLEVKISLKRVEDYLATDRRHMIISAILRVLIVVSLSGGFIWMVVHIPVKKLIAGTKEVSNGNLDHVIDIRSQDEIGVLAQSFNEMTRKLKQAYDEIKQWSATLEQRVIEKTEEVNRAQRHLIQVEKMASLGKLAATVAHELNNPLEGILTYARLSARRLRNQRLSQEDIQETDRELSVIADEAIRCGNIVKNLLIFAKQRSGELFIQDLNQIIEKSLNILQHHFEIQEIRLEKELCEDDSMLLCDPNLLQQAFIALFVNAVEAMPEGGTLFVVTQNIASEWLQITIRDTGVGIAESDLPHIFEPFFTTKDEDKGTGLGISVVYGIVEQHGGTIDVQSQIHQGTTVTLCFPKNLDVAQKKS